MTFKMPLLHEKYEVKEEEILRKVEPLQKKGTARTLGLYQFKNIQKYNFD